VKADQTVCCAQDDRHDRPIFFFSRDGKVPQVACNDTETRTIANREKSHTRRPVTELRPSAPHTLDVSQARRHERDFKKRPAVRA